MEDKETSSFGRSVGVFFVGLLKILLGIIVLGLIGLVIYFGVVYLHQEVIRPLQNSEQVLSNLQDRMETNQDQIDQRLADFNSRMTALESQDDLDQESLSELQARAAKLETLTSDQAAALKELDQMQKDLAGLQVTVKKLMVTPEPVEVADDPAVVSLVQEVGLLKAMTLLSRSRAYLLQGSYDLAAEDLKNSGVVLKELEASFPEDKAAVLQSLVQRIELAGSSLPANPVLAAEDLEIAWRILVNELAVQAAPEVQAEETVLPLEQPDGALPTPTAQPPSGTPTPTPIPTLTSTPSL